MERVLVYQLIQSHQWHYETYREWGHLINHLFTHKKCLVEVWKLLVTNTWEHKEKELQCVSSFILYEEANLVHPSESVFLSLLIIYTYSWALLKKLAQPVKLCYL